MCGQPFTGPRPYKIKQPAITVFKMIELEAGMNPGILDDQIIRYPALFDIDHRIMEKVSHFFQYRNNLFVAVRTIAGNNIRIVLTGDDVDVNQAVQRKQTPPYLKFIASDLQSIVGRIDDVNIVGFDKLTAAFDGIADTRTGIADMIGQLLDADEILCPQKQPADGSL